MASLSTYVPKAGTFEFQKVSSLRKASFLLAGAILAAIITCYYTIQAQIFVQGWMGFALIIGLTVLAWNIDKLGDTPVGYAAVIGAGAVLGLMSNVPVYYLLATGQVGVVIQAASSTFILFALMAVLSFFTNIDFTKMVPFLFIVSIGLLVMILLNTLFFHSAMISLIMAYGIAALSCAGILARLSYVAQGGQLSAVVLALSLLIDLYNLFMALLRIFSNRN